jgi:hypothetical protein
MILRNYYNLLVGVITGNTQGPATANDNFGPGSLLVGRYVDGYKLGWPGRANSGDLIALLNITGVNMNGIIFGTGTTDVSFDDQKLGQAYEKISGANYSCSAPVYNETTGKFECQFSCVIANTGSSEVTLTEVGIVKPNMYYYYGGTSRNSNYVLVYRELLENPITIGVGENVQYTHKFEIAIPEIS